MLIQAREHWNDKKIHRDIRKLYNNHSRKSHESEIAQISKLLKFNKATKLGHICHSP
jgi:hypothetical protein